MIDKNEIFEQIEMRYAKRNSKKIHNTKIQVENNRQNFCSDFFGFKKTRIETKIDELNANESKLQIDKF